MVGNQWKNRFEEIAHEINNLESPSLVRKRELASIVLKQLEEERSDHINNDMDPNDFSFDEELFRVIFEDSKYYSWMRNKWGKNGQKKKEKQ